jgi:hypothetical protein
LKKPAFSNLHNVAHLNGRIDEGHILIQDAVPLEPDAGPFEVKFRKTLKAADHIGNMVKMLKKQAS